MFCNRPGRLVVFIEVQESAGKSGGVGVVPSRRPTRPSCGLGLSYADNCLREQQCLLSKESAFRSKIRIQLGVNTFLHNYLIQFGFLCLYVREQEQNSSPKRGKIRCAVTMPQFVKDSFLVDNKEVMTMKMTKMITYLME